MTIKRIDQIALTLLGATGFYLFFLALGLPVALCAVMAFAGMALARRALEGLPRQTRATPAQARAALLSIAMLPEDAAAERLQTLTGRDALTPVLRHPSARLDAAAVFDLWRSHRGDGAICLAATCPADPEAFQTARSLGIGLIDAAALEKHLRRTGAFIPPDAPRQSLPRRLRRALRRIMNRPASPRAALYGISLLFMYRVTRLPLYLLSGLAVLGVTGVRRIEKGR